MDRYTSRRTTNTHGIRRFADLGMVLGLATIGLSGTGCVDRTVKINSEPPGALVFLNDEEVGRAPVKVNFTWYGDYDIILRHKGYKTLQTNRRIEAPWYQWPGIDLVTECLIPMTIHDDRDFGTFTLEKSQKPTKTELIQRAEDMRAMAVGGNATPPEPSVAAE